MLTAHIILTTMALTAHLIIFLISLMFTSVNDDYDPNTDPARKANSKDPGWKYGYQAHLANLDEVTCNFCGATKKNEGLRG